ncbi:methyltransferase type 11 [Saccharopolyspora subtropica]|uniref:27-O-demethylrifamycin SV methyltransferase n=1 Tax=Saccharopolyspora thermophila TaxID=89367 RepID=A0A917JUJ8_9PSEU|nr:methyltransferase domain-containing protein [Saccharopolyspora subtropica]GGI87754.1 methyltransferase type 11 [Saccharopolyspora subtropica]
MTEQFTAAEVAEFYDGLERFLSSWLGESIHYGYWPDGPGGSFTDAQDRLTALVGEKLALRPEERLLDVGCGTGRPATLLARATGCIVTGITISRRQLETAVRRDVDGVAFTLADAMDMPFADGEFDAALALESLLHMPDQKGALAEVHRVLRPGGRLVVADFFQITPAPEQPGGVPFTPPPPLPELTDRIRAAGFEVTDVVDITGPTRPTYDELLAAVAAQRSTLDSVTERIAEQVQRAIPQIVAHARRYTGYAVVTAHRA